MQVDNLFFEETHIRWAHDIKNDWLHWKSHMNCINVPLLAGQNKDTERGYLRLKDTNILGDKHRALSLS